jgi:hypothetical protein
VVALIAFSVIVIINGGFKGRFSPQAVIVASFLDSRSVVEQERARNCFITDANLSVSLDRDQCLQLAERKKNYLLIGDSHAMMLWSGLKSSFPDANILLVSVSNCKPLVYPAGTSDCKNEMSYIFQTYLPSHPIQGLLLEARWKPQDMARLTDTVAWAKQHQVPVIIFGPVAEYDAPMPRLLAYSIAWNNPELASKHLLAYSPTMDAQMQSLATSTWHVPYISLYKATCNRDGCIEYADAAHEVPLMRDGDHFTDAGSALVIRRLINRGELF